MPKLDAIANLLLPQPEVFASEDFSADQSITHSKVFNGSDDTLTVIVPPWHANHRVQNSLAQRQKRAGHTVLAYDLHDDILSPDPQQTIDSFTFIGQRMADDIRAIMYEKSITRVRYVAASLGCAVLMYAMGEHDLEGQVDMVVPGGNLAGGLWHGVRTQHLRRTYEEKGIDEVKLKSLWHDLAPAYQATKIRNSSFRLFVSEDDLVIPPESVKGLVLNLRTNGNKVEKHVNKRLGHFGTILLQGYLGRHSAVATY